MGEHVTCIANQGETVGNNSSNNLHDKNTARYNAREDQPLPLMCPVLMFMSMLIFDMIIIYAMDVFDDVSPVKYIFI